MWTGPSGDAAGGAGIEHRMHLTPVGAPTVRPETQPPKTVQRSPRVSNRWVFLPVPDDVGAEKPQNWRC